MTMLYLKLTAIFLGRLLNALFPTLCVLLAAALCLRIRSFREECVGSPRLRFLLICVLSMSGIRLITFFSGVPYQGRYLHPIVIIACIPAAVGLELILKSGIHGKLRLSSHVFAGLMLGAVLLSHAGKALHPPAQKKWLRQIPEAISAAVPGGGAVLISTCDDMRLEYYSGAKQHLFGLGPDRELPKSLGAFREIGECRIFSAEYFGNDIRWMPGNFRPGLGGIAEAAEKWGGKNVFVLLEWPKQDIDAALKERGITLPLDFVGEYENHKKQKIALYRGR